MKVSKRAFRSVQKALNYWQQQNLLDDLLHQTLQNSLEEKKFDWQKLAHYTFLVAVSCMVMALYTVLTDKELVTLIQHLFDAPYLVKSGFFLLVAGGLFGWGIKICKKTPERTVSYETLYFSGVMSIAGSLFFLGAYLDTGSGHFSILILLGAIIYLMIGGLISSPLVWVLGLISLAIGITAETSFQSDWGTHYFGMNYSFQIMILGLILLCLSYNFRRITTFFFRNTQIMALLYFFVGLWLLSINGNTSDWNFPGHAEVLWWIALSGCCSVLAIVSGIKMNDDVLRGFGLIFLLLNGCNYSALSK